jgi:hypothetical protein
MSAPVRRRVDVESVASVARRLTPRDRALCHLLAEHRVLTTAQIADVAFGSMVTAQHRMTVLHRLRVLERFRHWRPVGSDPFHYVLDEIGAEIVAADQGVDPPKRGQTRARALALADSQRLAHLVGVNLVFCSLARWARHQPDAALERWWSERRCAQQWNGVVRPDGSGVLRRSAHRVEFVLEYDRGTEPLTRLPSKLDIYPDLAQAVDWQPWVAFWFPSPRREAEPDVSSTATASPWSLALTVSALTRGTGLAAGGLDRTPPPPGRPARKPATEGRVSKPARRDSAPGGHEGRDASPDRPTGSAGRPRRPRAPTAPDPPPWPVWPEPCWPWPRRCTPSGLRFPA